MNRILTILRRQALAQSNSNDADLLERFCHHGDEAAFTQLVHRYGPLVYGTCHRLLPNCNDAEDAFQATFLVLIRRVHELSIREKLGSWLYRVAVLCAKNIRRQNARRSNRITHSELDSLDVSHATIVSTDLRIDLDQALLKLPEKYRLPIVLCHLQGWSRQQAAEYLGCPEGTLSALLSRALDKLRSRLAKEEVLSLFPALVVVPTGLAINTVRLVRLDGTANLTNHLLSANVRQTSQEVLRMFWFKKIITSTSIVMMGLLIFVSVRLTPNTNELTAQTTQTKKITHVEQQPTLKEGNWVLLSWDYAPSAERKIILSIRYQEDKPIIQLLPKFDTDHVYKAETIHIEGNQITIPFTWNGQSYKFVGLLDPHHPERVLGSLSQEFDHVCRAALEQTKLEKLERKDFWIYAKYPDSLAKAKHIILEEKYTKSDLEQIRDNLLLNPNYADPAQENKDREEQKNLQQKLEHVTKQLKDQVPDLLKQTLSNKPNENVLFEMYKLQIQVANQLQATEKQVSEWLDKVLTFAKQHGPIYENYILAELVDMLNQQNQFPNVTLSFAQKASQGWKNLSILTQFRRLDALKTAQLNAGQMEAAKVTDELLEDVEDKLQGKLDNPEIRAFKPKLGIKIDPEQVLTAKIVGTVTDANGQPIPNAIIRLNNIHSDGPVGKFQPAYTDAKGNYEMPLRFRIGKVEVRQMWAESKQYVQLRKLVRQRAYDGTTIRIDFQLQAGEILVGKILFANNQEDSDHSWFEVLGINYQAIHKAAQDGSFEIAVPKGTYTIKPLFGDGPKWSGIQSGSTNLVLDEKKVSSFEWNEKNVGEQFDLLWQEMDRKYSYFFLKKEIDWSKIKETYRPKAIAAKSTKELAKVLQEMLTPLNDLHIWIKTPSETLGTGGGGYDYNGNPKVIRSQLTDTTECGQFALVGKTKSDGFGYFLMIRQSNANQENVKKAVEAIQKLKEAPGFIVDLRSANGGNEQLAREIAKQFCAEQIIYAKSKFRDGPKHTDFTQNYDRILQAVPHAYTKPVICLIGPGAVSSGEGFVKMMKCLPHVTTVGLPTRGSSGNPAGFELKGTDITVWFSRWVDMLPDGTTIEGVGIPPTIEVKRPMEDYKEADPTLEKGFEVLREKIKQAKK